MDQLMQMVLVCREFGWTFDEYQAQPAFFIAAAKEMMRMDAQEQKVALSRIKHGG